MAAKSVLITGCSSGIGEAAALRLRQRGWRVFATARRISDLDGLRSAGCDVLALDVADEESRVSAVREAEAAAGGALDALVNNAGYSLSGALETLDMDAVRRQFETNVFGLLRLCQLALPGMRARGRGRIVNVGSIGGRMTFPGGGAYHATKHAVEALSDAMRFETAGFGVQVVLIQPGLIRSRFAETATAPMASLAGEGPYATFNAAIAKATKAVYERGALARLGGGPEDVAKTIDKALSVPRPKARYSVTPSAKLLLKQRAVMSDKAWDRFLASNFPRPGR